MDYPISGQAPNAAESTVPHLVSGGVAVPVGASNPLPTTAADSYRNITTNTTTAVKSGAGTLVRIVVNTKGAAANTATLYDNLAGSGTRIGTLDTVNGAIASIEYGCAFATGLTIVTATGTAADITVVYR
jgi:hypothetical protein